MSAVLTTQTYSPALQYIEVKQHDWNTIFNFIENKGLNNLFPAFGILNHIDNIDVVEYNREYEVTIFNIPVIFTFEKENNIYWKWKTIIGKRTFTCKLKEIRYRELLDRLHLRVGI